MRSLPIRVEDLKPGTMIQITLSVEDVNTAVRIREGRNLPLLTTATGRVFLAFMPDNEIKDLLNHELARQTEMLPKRKAVDLSNVQALRAEVLRHGLGRMIGEENPGLVAIAASRSRDWRPPSSRLCAP